MLTTGITTDHYDKKLKYKYKRMPKGKRRKYVKRVKFIRSVIDNSLGGTYATKYHVPAIADESALSGKQVIFGCVMGEGLPIGGSTATLGQTTGEYAGELVNAIQQRENLVDSSLISTIANYKYTIASNGMNTILHNESSDTCVLDVYTFICRKDLPLAAMKSAAANGANPNLSMGNLYEWMLEEESFTVGGGLATRHTYAQIPFQNHHWCKYFKIVKVQELKIPGGSNVTLSMRTAKNFVWDSEKFQGKWCVKGITQGYLFRARGVPTDTDVIAAPLSIRYVTEYHTSLKENRAHLQTVSVEDK
jgi:hypothetical protein